MTDCPLVMIEWEDSLQPVGAWTHLAGYKPAPMMRISSVGWLIHDGEDTKSLAPNIGGLEDECSAQVTGVIQIPARCVVSVQKLKEPVRASSVPSSHPGRGQKRRRSSAPSG